jgi:branched-chain amino acid aminotransferase
MTDGAHIRLMVTRDRKARRTRSRSINGRTIVSPPTKTPDPAIKSSGIRLFTSTFRCSAPDVFDLRLNCIVGWIIQALQAIKAGAGHIGGRSAAARPAHQLFIVRRVVT